MAADKKMSAMTKAATDITTVNAPQSAPAGYEKSVRGASFVGYWRAETNDVIDCILRGPAPAGVQAKSQSKHGVALVELIHEAIVTMGARQLEGLDMSRWVAGPKNRRGEDTFVTKAMPGEIICVSIREGIKDEMQMVDGTKVWLKVGKQRPVPGTDNFTMYDYEKFTQAPPAPAGSAGARANSGAQSPAVPWSASQ